MTIYHNFIGIDIGKFTFVVGSHGSKETKEYTNDSAGIGTFIADYAKADSLYILETTGGHEINLLYTLCAQNFAVHRANTRKVKNLNSLLYRFLVSVCRFSIISSPVSILFILQGCLF